MDILYAIYYYIIYSPHVVSNLFDFLYFHGAQKRRIIEKCMLFFPMQMQYKYNKNNQKYIQIVYMTCALNCKSSKPFRFLCGFRTTLE